MGEPLLTFWDTVNWRELPGFDFEIKSGDRLPHIAVLLYDTSATAFDLSGCTAKFLMRPKGGTAPKVDAAATIVTSGSPSRSIVKYEWAAGDTDTAGAYDAEFEVTTSGGLKRTWPAGGYPTYLAILITGDVG